MANRVSVSFMVRGIVRKEPDGFVAGYPRLELYSQGDSPEQAKENAREALRLWFGSCIDRGTLGEALRELGWHRAPDDATDAGGVSADAEHIMIVRHLEDSLGEPWEDTITIPAYQAAEFNAAIG